MADPQRRGEISADGSCFYDGEDWGWQPLWLTAHQVQALVLTEFGVRALSVELLADGLLNQTWRLHCADRDRVLRVGRSERTRDQVRYEDRVVSSWSRIPQIVGPVSNHHPVVDGHVLTLYPYREGRPGTEVDPVVRARQVAPVMARMHRSSVGLDLPQRPGARSIDEVPAADRWLPVRAAVIDRFGTGEEIMAAARVVDDAVAELDEILQRWRGGDGVVRRAVVHADLNARNQLYENDRLVGIIDTDDCRIEPLVAEVAGLAYSDLAVSPSTVWRDYLAAGGPLEPSDEEMLLPFARLGALGELEWFTDDNGVATHLADRHLQVLASDLGGSPVRG
ncbi:phosphotransferase enzyme family protein [Microlunatus sp. Gsoil 973]|uniref:phosphotransferase enzyme family protein n=1 Tax=Microlunatus sp. Gsoil 973 TaxID=2672569 RepID=UPI0012B45ED9|nr:phosphotransferase [Microlunatus sp. Gsoil 973]QGN32488.1 phosphotransferase [Microlunatus sp. Gsoil 973]